MSTAQDTRNPLQTDYSNNTKQLVHVFVVPAYSRILLSPEPSSPGSANVVKPAEMHCTEVQVEDRKGPSMHTKHHEL